MMGCHRSAPRMEGLLYEEVCVSEERRWGWMKFADNGGFVLEFVKMRGS